MPPPSEPMRSFGPGRSWRIATCRPTAAAAARTRRAFSACSSRSPWEKFSRATSIPARTIRSSVWGSREAGPMVATILVRRIEPASYCTRSTRGERPGQLSARADLELHECVAQVVLDGLGGDEQRFGDLAVGEAIGGEANDPQLACRKRLLPPLARAPRPRAEHSQLRSSARLQSARAGAAGGVEALLQRRERLAPAPLPAQARAEL